MTVNGEDSESYRDQGLRLRDEWGMYDARKKYQVPEDGRKANPACRCGDVLQGKMLNHPTAKYFGKVCTPQHPVGACMVSGEEPVQHIICMEENKKIDGK